MIYALILPMRRLLPKSSGLIALLIMFASNPAIARVIHVCMGDVHSSSLHGPAGGAGATWNTWSPLLGPLRDSEGNATPVEVTAEGNGPYGDWWCDLQFLSAGLAVRPDQGSKLVRISGLDPNISYDLYVACARGALVSNTLCTPLNQHPPVLSQQADNHLTGDGSTWVRDSNYVLFQGLAVDEAGVVEFTYEGISGYGIMNGLQIVDVGEASKTYLQWASEPAQGLGTGLGSGPSEDPDYDGFSNLLEFAMNGRPLTPSPEIGPKFYRSVGEHVFEYDRRDSSKPPSTEQAVEYSSDLLEWTSVLVPAVSNAGVSITDHGPFDRVQVSLPATLEQFFVRLRVTDLTPLPLSSVKPANGVSVEDMTDYEGR